MADLTFKVLPLKSAYVFLEANGLSDEAEKIRTSKERLGSYTTTLRRAKVVSLLKDKNLLKKFIEEHWPSGAILDGEKHVEFLAKVYERYETGQTVIDPQIEEAPEKESFAYEEDLRDYLAQSLGILEDGLAPTSKSREPGAFAGFLRAKSPIEVLSGISQNQKAGLWKTWAYCLFSSHSASF